MCLNYHEPLLWSGSLCCYAFSSTGSGCFCRRVHTFSLSLFVVIFSSLSKIIPSRFFIFAARRMGLFGQTKVDPKAQVDEWTKTCRQSARDMDRQVRSKLFFSTVTLLKNNSICLFFTALNGECIHCQMFRERRKRPSVPCGMPQRRATRMCAKFWPER